MAEAIISRRGAFDGSSSGSVVTELIVLNTNWKAPKAKNQTFSVRIFGGGCAGLDGYGRGGGGGSGWMNNGELQISDNTTISITIGDGSTNHDNAGGTSSFGTYLSANGGLGSDGGAGGFEPDGGGWGGMITPTGNNYNGIGYQFGGGAAYVSVLNWEVGSGGLYGGGGGLFVGITGRGDNSIINSKGGTYGGGGGLYSYIYRGQNYSTYTGVNGGEYGGGGGLVAVHDQKANSSGISYRGGIGGKYGGNGGLLVYEANNYSDSPVYRNLSEYKVAQNGTNTSTWTNVFNDGNGYFRGRGLAGNNYGAGGGGFGGNGGHQILNANTNNANRIYDNMCGGGGGGGYGSNGGTVYYNAYSGGGGGGGGGYGGDGGNNWGGGGGYGKSAKGGDNMGGGGGYYGKGGTQFGGGGGYGPGGDMEKSGKFGGGGGGSTGGHPGSGGDGICIIQYYI